MGKSNSNFGKTNGSNFGKTNGSNFGKTNGSNFGKNYPHQTSLPEIKTNGSDLQS
jgi:hypothetical protein